MNGEVPLCSPEDCTQFSMTGHNGKGHGYTGFPGDSAAKNPPAVQETWVWSLGREDPLEQGMATHSSILAWRIPWTEELNGLQSTGLQKVRHD